MKRELLKILMIIASAVILAVGLHVYLNFSDQTVGGLVRGLTEAAGGLFASEKTTVVEPVELDFTESEDQTGSGEESGNETAASGSADTLASQTETVQDLPETSKGEEAAANVQVEGEETVSAGKEAPSAYQIEDFEIIYQMPELPTGCEVVALTMVLQYYGFDVDKTTMASEYLPTVDATFYYGNDGKKYGPDLNVYFVGDPFGSGYICGTTAIVTAADGYLQDAGSSMRAVDMTGTSVEELYQLVSEDTPVVVWVAIGMATRAETSGWYTESGEYVEWSTNDHGAVLIGYDEDTVMIADPISGMIECNRDAFESVFQSRGNQCVILQ
ncbi:MAG: C39 family peptidase [Lachnospiraceae bacterium]|nr:C39 family peptidase [Lachnospiraceae bacterium]